MKGLVERYWLSHAVIASKRVKTIKYLMALPSQVAQPLSYAWLDKIYLDGHSEKLDHTNVTTLSFLE
jgi:hypothetical protein